MELILVEARAVSFSYRTKPILAGVDLALERGLVHAVIGPTGCGKTTLLHLLAGLVRPKSGEIIYSAPEDARRVALIPQDYGLFQWKTVRKNAEMGIEIQHKDAAGRKKALERCGRLMEELRIAELADRWPVTLSGGQKQRVAVARALAVAPSLLLMDEPFSALDADIREELQDLLRSLPGRYGATPVIVTHDIAEALRVADRLVLFRPEAGGEAPFTVELLANPEEYRQATEATLRAALRSARERKPDAAASGGRNEA